MKLFGSYRKRRKEFHSEEKSNNNSETKPLRFSIFYKFTHSVFYSKFKIPLMVFCCLLLFVLIAVLIYSIWEKPPEVISYEPVVQETARITILDPVSESESPILTPTFAPLESPIPKEGSKEEIKTGRRDNCYTFVILAYDQMKANTDTVLVGNFDIEAGKLNFVNIPRDTLVNVSWGVKKLNSILANESNEPEKFLEHLGNLIGFTVDFYAIVDIKATEKLIDCIGGVYYNVPRNMDYDDPTQDLSIHIEKGYQHLSGEDVVKVLRFRVGNDNTGYPNGDLGRIHTQQDLLGSVASQFLSLGNIPNLDNAIQIVLSSVTTNLTSSNIAFLIRQFLLLEKDNISFSTMPGDGVSIRGGFYYQTNIDEWVGIVNDYLNPFYQVITADNLNILQENGAEGALSTTGEIIPMNSFYDFSQYLG